MKLLVFCLLVIGNISNNGKASLESFPSTRLNGLVQESMRKSGSSCYRPCKFNEKPRQCFYSFEAGLSFNSNDEPAITINNWSPGPPINVCLNDVIIVDVKNKIQDQDLAIHWHGVEQKGTPFMDGVPMVTQCPIVYGSTFRYAFVASSPGTFFYHADSVLHQSDGLYGALVVNQQPAFEPHLSLYDYDRSEEHTILIAAKFQALLTGDLDGLAKKPSALIIHSEENHKMPGFAYRLRFINVIAVECPVTLRIDKHEMTVIASDGRPVKAMTVESVQLYPGERADVVVSVPEEDGVYTLKARGSGVCSGLESSTMFFHSGANYTSTIGEQKDKNTLERSSRTILGQNLQSYLTQDSGRVKIKKYYLGIDKVAATGDEKVNDFSYTMDSTMKKPFYPAVMSTSGVVQINSKNFLYPSSPMVLSPAMHDDAVCEVGKEKEAREPQCVQVLHADKGDILEVALVNEGLVSIESYTFHMHGYGMQVVATHQNEDDSPISREKFFINDTLGLIKRNLRDPPIKDTILVPNKGYTIVRIHLDHGGSWLLECRSCGMFSLPAAIVIRVPQVIPKTVTDSLPKCGSYKPPDVLLN